MLSALPTYLSLGRLRSKSYKAVHASSITCCHGWPAKQDLGFCSWRYRLNQETSGTRIQLANRTRCQSESPTVGDNNRSKDGWWQISSHRAWSFSTAGWPSHITFIPRGKTSTGDRQHTQGGLLDSVQSQRSMNEAVAIGTSKLIQARS
jgi:hypothetical protein